MECGTFFCNPRSLVLLLLLVSCSTNALDNDVIDARMGASGRRRKESKEGKEEGAHIGSRTGKKEVPLEKGSRRVANSE